MPRPQIAAELKAVLFDFGGTLDAAAVPWKARMFRLFCAEGCTVDAAQFDAVFYRTDDALVGSIPPTLSLDATVRCLVDALGTALGLVDGALRKRIADRFLEDAIMSLHARRPLLSRLARRYELGVVSNFYGNLATVCKEAGINPFFRVVVDSAAVGVSKPDPRIFRHALDRLGVEPWEAMFVGDSLSRDMAGARQIAMPHIWLIGDAVPAPRPCCPSDPVIRSLEDVERHLP